MGDGQLQYHKRNRNPHQKLEGIWSLILFGLLQWRCLHEQLKLHAPLHLQVFAVHFPLKHKHLPPVDLIWICLRILNTVSFNGAFGKGLNSESPFESAFEIELLWDSFLESICAFGEGLNSESPFESASETELPWDSFFESICAFGKGLNIEFPLNQPLKQNYRGTV